MISVSCKRTDGFLFGLFLLLAAAGPVSAQQLNTVYSLVDLVDSARRHLPLLLEKQALIQSAEYGIKEAKHAYLPQLNATEEISVGSANDLAGPYLPLPGLIHPLSGSIEAAPEYRAVTGNMASVYGQYELVNFGLRSARVANARAIAGLTRADLEKEFYLVKWQIGKLYFEILRSRYQLAVDEEDVKRHLSIYTISRALSASGINPGVDSSLAKAGLSRTRISYNEAAAQLRRLQQQLVFLTGIATPDIAMDTARDKALVSAAGLPADLAAPANPLLDYFAWQKLQYGAEVTMARKSYLPKIMVGAGGWARGSSLQFNNVYSTAGEGLGYQRLNYLAGLGITYDLFNGVHRRDRLAVLDRQVAAADYALQQEQLSLRNQQLQADESIRTAIANLAELPAQLQAATDAYHQKLAQYKAGIINLVDLSTASFELYQAQSDYIRTLNGWYTASLDKAAAMGNLDLFIQTIK
jgi:outer membrane protein TolC